MSPDKGGGVDGKPHFGRGAFNEEYVDLIHNDNLLRKYNLCHDVAPMYKIDILRKYPMPEFDNEYFVAESLLVDRMGLDGYKTRWYNRVIYVSEYLPDGLSRNAHRQRLESPQGIMAYLSIKEESGVISSSAAEEERLKLYLCQAAKFGTDETNKKLYSLPQDVLTRYEGVYRAIVDSVKNFLSRNKVKKVIIYGLGNIGRAFVHFASECDLPILCGIDKKVREMEGISEVISPEEFPYAVDDDTYIIVTLGKYDDEVSAFLTSHTDRFIYWRDISCDQWNVIYENVWI